MLHITLPYACFGLVVSGERIISAPPIARWTIGRFAADVTAYYRRRGAVVQRIP